jgi:sensor histidine kinase YesM
MPTPPSTQSHIVQHDGPAADRPRLDADPRDYAKEIAVVVIGNTAIATILHLAGVDGGFMRLFVFSQSIGLCIAALVQTGRRMLGRRNMTRYPILFVCLAAAIVAGTIGGIVLASLILGLPLADKFNGRSIQLTFAVAFIATLVACWFGWSRSRLAQLGERAAQASLRLERAEKSAMLAQLQALQAQVEPHFLFNALAALDSLIASDPPRARVLLANLNRFLRAALAASRADNVSLADEFAIIDAMLAVQQMRFGERLCYTLDLPPSCAALKFAPLLLQPLVENAVKHGIEPALDGGTIMVTAQCHGDRLQLTVMDTGVGFSTGARPAGSGCGLSNVRARLRALYGANATLTISEHGPRGVAVRLDLPISRSGMEGQV